MKYVPIQPMTKDAVAREIASRDTARVTRALVAAALHEPDRSWVEDLVARAITSHDAQVRSVAITCVGHVARVHGALDLDRFGPLLRCAAESDRVLAGRVDEALSDI